MMKYYGKPVQAGMAAGPVYVLKKERRQVKYGETGDVQDQIGRVQRAVEQSKEQLGDLARRALCQAGEEGAAIFAAQEMILEDEEYLEAIYGRIRGEKAAAEYAVAMAGRPHTRP